MTLRTRNRGRQWLAWLGAACACAAAYALAVCLFGTGDAAAWYAPEQMRFFLPFAFLFGFVAYETRWDGVRRATKADSEDEAKPSLRSDSIAECGQWNFSSPRSPNRRIAESKNSAASRAIANPVAAGRAIGKVRAPIGKDRALPCHTTSDGLHSNADSDTLLQEAEAGSASAMETLCEQARKRGRTVEAYFWAAWAEKCGSASASSKMLTLRRTWILDGCPAQRRNVHDGFSEERGSVARALLRMSCGRDVALARQRLHDLAESGQPDARLFVQVSRRRVP